MKILIFCFGFGLYFSLAASVNADSYVEKKMPFSDIPFKTWTKGEKPRTEMTIPLFGAGTTITIIRADKGVQWTINSKDQTYFESPLTVRTTEKLPPDEPYLTHSANSDPTCKGRFKKLSDQRVIAGVKAVTYQEFCQEAPNQVRTHWFAPNSGLAAEIQKEETNFLKARSAAQNADRSEKEKKDLEKMLLLMQDKVQRSLPEKDKAKWPKGYVLAMETEMDGKKILNFEVTKMSREKIDASLFEIPAGYTKSDPFQSLLKRRNELHQEPQPITK